MNFCRNLTLLILLVLPAHNLLAQTSAEGAVTGILTDQKTHAPLENVTVTLRDRGDSTHVVGTTTGKDGGFLFAHVPPGAYLVECSLIGHVSFRSPQFQIDPAHPRMNLKTIPLKQSVLVLDEVVIHSEKSLFNHAIDRRIYNVQHDLMAKSSSASEILQNIPAVQVDIDGNVSLRGSPDVMILINGKKSPLMGKSRADVLQQLPAGNIEKIEVITNPSARFTPEGTSGIINIVMKQGSGAGVNGDATGHYGTADRHNENFSFGYNPRKLELFGNYSYRDDRRNRTGTDQRDLSDSGPTRTYEESNRILVRPHVNLGNLGLSYHPDPRNTVDLSGEYFHRRPSRNGVSTIVSRDDAGAIVSDYDRRQTGYELETEAGVTTAFQHDFARADHEVRVEASVSNAPQSEVASFVEDWRTPAQARQASNIQFRQREEQAHVSVDYSDPVSDESKLEAGYALEIHRQDIHSHAESLDVAQQRFFADGSKTYRFKLDQAIHAVYGTYARVLRKLSALGGLRGEYANVTPDLVSNGVRFVHIYSGLYPTLHLAYKASASGEVQLNYSRRINRPDSDDLNPFPEFTDPYNMEAGNTHLKPESIHSVELGYRQRGEHFSFFPSLYYRYKQDGITRLTTAVNDSVFLRTKANLASDQSAGFEPVLTVSVGRVLQGNLNANVFYDQIDASNIGYGSRKSVVSWSGACNVNLTPWTATTLQLSSNYRSTVLTPQGNSRPSFVLNLGAKQNLVRDQVSLTLTVSDLFKTQRQDTQLDVSGIRQRVTNRRDSRIVYAGVIYHYGRTEKKDKDKDKDKPFQYEDQP